jgi:hypothetical protein
MIEVTVTKAETGRTRTEDSVYAHSFAFVQVGTLFCRCSGEPVYKNGFCHPSAQNQLTVV